MFLFRTRPIELDSMYNWHGDLELALTKRLWIPTCFELYDIDIVEFPKSWAPPSYVTKHSKSNTNSARFIAYLSKVIKDLCKVSESLLSA